MGVVILAKLKRNSIQKYENHSFYCLNCGHKGIPIWRNKGHLHSKNHRKTLYCPYCQLTVNHIEIRSYEEAIQFQEKFSKGLFKDEAQESIQYLKNSFKEELCYA